MKYAKLNDFGINKTREISIGLADLREEAKAYYADYEKYSCKVLYGIMGTLLAIPLFLILAYTLSSSMFVLLGIDMAALAVLLVIRKHIEDLRKNFETYFNEEVSQIIKNPVYVVSITHKILHGAVTNAEVDGSYIYFDIEGVGHICENRVFFTHEDACIFLFNIEKNHIYWYDTILNREATKQLLGSPDYAVWLRGYFKSKDYFVENQFNWEDISLYLENEEDFVDFLNWLVYNKLRKSRTIAKQYNVVLKAFAEYCKYF